MQSQLASDIFPGLTLCTSNLHKARRWKHVEAVFPLAVTRSGRASKLWPIIQQRPVGAARILGELRLKPRLKWLWEEDSHHAGYHNIRGSFITGDCNAYTYVSDIYNKDNMCQTIRSGGSVVRAFAPWAGGRGFDPRPRYTKDVIKMVPDAPLLSAQHTRTELASLSARISFKKRDGYHLEWAVEGD